MASRTTILLIASLTALAACGGSKTAGENTAEQADAVADNIDQQADTIEQRSDEVANGATSDAMENQAEALENKADAVRDAGKKQGKALDDLGGQ